jgi:hypothetical protein
MTPDVTNQVTAGLLILTLSSVLCIGLILTFFVLIYLRGTRTVLRPGEQKLPDDFGNIAVCPGECPGRWLAIRSGSIRAVQNALGLNNPVRCSWSDGLSQATEHSLFIAPPVRGWILVIGQAVPDPAEDIDECYRLITRLSAALGRVQFFSVNRTVNHHAWAEAHDGRIVRGYAWAGQTLWNQGIMTRAERELEMQCFGYGEFAETVHFFDSHPQSVNSDKVGLLAARWSVDPVLAEAQFFAAPGIAGDWRGLARG